jgi:hypothetical protein
LSIEKLCEPLQSHLRGHITGGQAAAADRLPRHLEKSVWEKNVSAIFPEEATIREETDGKQSLDRNDEFWLDLKDSKHD